MCQIEPKRPFGLFARGWSSRFLGPQSEGDQVHLVTATTLVVLLLIPGMASAQDSKRTISVRVFVDEEEPRVERLWKETLARRIDEASQILSQYGRIRFSVTKFGTWESNNANVQFADSLKEFEKETRAHPAELAVGFTSQYRLTRGRSNLGGTRGPLRPHILIREGAPRILEAGRLEVLVHELAHYLGAAHSGRSDSVMRPILGDGQSRARAFRIRLDENNAEIVRLVSTELSWRRIRSMHQISLPAKQALRSQYAQLAKSLPTDEVAKRYVQLMDKSIEYSLRQRKNTSKQATPNLAPRPN